MYQVSGLSEKAAAFVNTCALDLLQGGIRIDVLEQDGRLRVVIDVDDDATNDGLRAAIPLALAWRDRLMEWQGPWAGGGKPFAMEQLLWKKQRRTYAELAGEINAQVAAHLCQHIDDLCALEAERASIKTWGDFDAWQLRTGRHWGHDDAARYILQLVGLKEAAIEAAVRSGLERIRNGQEPFEPGEPITPARIEAALKAWRIGKKHKLLQRRRAAEKR